MVYEKSPVVLRSVEHREVRKHCMISYAPDLTLSLSLLVFISLVLLEFSVLWDSQGRQEHMLCVCAGPIYVGSGTNDTWEYEFPIFVYLSVARFVCHLSHEGVNERQMCSSPMRREVACNLSYLLYSKQLKWGFRKAFPAVNLSELISACKRSKSSVFWLLEYKTNLLWPLKHAPCGRQAWFNAFHSTLNHSSGAEVVL